MFSQSIYNKKYVKVIISENWTLDSLHISQKKVKELYNIDLIYKNLILRDNNTIKGIDIEVKTNDGYKGDASIEDITKKNKFGFFRDYKMFTKTNFAVGYLEIKITD